MSVHSGRIVGKSFIGGTELVRAPSVPELIGLPAALRSSFPAVEKSHPNYMYHANEGEETPF